MITIIHKEIFGLLRVTSKNRHEYIVELPDSNVILNFQNDDEAGLTNEALIAIIKHRIGLQNMLDYSAENVSAIIGLESALNALNSKTLNKMVHSK